MALNDRAGTVGVAPETSYCSAAPGGRTQRLEGIFSDSQGDRFFLLGGPGHAAPRQTGYSPEPSNGASWKGTSADFTEPLRNAEGQSSSGIPIGLPAAKMDDQDRRCLSADGDGAFLKSRRGVPERLHAARFYLQVPALGGGGSRSCSRRLAWVNSSALASGDGGASHPLIGTALC
jgi:hypothetical protein